MYPQWYKIEQETAKTIQTLTNMNELSFYLKNPDEYIRALAILRINTLKLQDAFYFLQDILGDDSESIRNKKLAAWTIKTLALYHNIDIFITDPLVDEFTGREQFRDIFKVGIINTLPKPRLLFPVSYIESELKVEGHSLHRSEDADLKAEFSPSQWMKACSNRLLIKIKEFFHELPILLKNSSKSLYKFIGIYFYIKPFQTFRKLFRGIKTKLKTIKKPMYSFSIRKFIRYIIRILTSPMRLIIRHKLFTLGTIIAFYCFLTLTPPGKLITSKYFIVDLVGIQDQLTTTVKNELLYTWGEFKELTGINKYHLNAKQTIKDASVKDAVKGTAYKVTATSGLNIREAPDSSANKIASVDYQATVMHLLKSQQDESGKVWFLVETHNGIKGWVYSKWLKSIGGE